MAARVGPFSKKNRSFFVRTRMKQDKSYVKIVAFIVLWHSFAKFTTRPVFLKTHKKRVNIKMKKKTPANLFV
jgi:hypothetical protein